MTGQYDLFGGGSTHAGLPVVIWMLKPKQGSDPNG
jgi:hypothetical protein